MRTAPRSRRRRRPTRRPRCGRRSGGTAGRVGSRFEARSSELFYQQVHEEAVRPLPADQLAAAHDPDWLEAYGGIGRDRALVGGVRVDREAVMPSLRREPADRGPEGVGAEAVALEAARERDVEAHRAVLGLRLLGEAEPAGELTARLDRPGVAVHQEVLAQPLGLVRLAPPVGHAGLANDRGEWLEVGLGDRPQG